MKIKDITEWSAHWSTPLGTMDANAPVADGVLVDLSLWGTSIIGLAVQCPGGKYFASIQSNVYDRVLEFLKRNHGRKLREVLDAEIDISDVIANLKAQRSIVTRSYRRTTFSKKERANAFLLVD